jgi:large repetitive protein
VLIPLTRSRVYSLTTSSTALTSSPNPADFHHRVTFTATVTSTSQGAPTGTVTFSDSGHALSTVGIAKGKAKFSTSSLDAGVHSITASYSGDDSLRPSTSPELDETIRSILAAS